MAIYRNGQTYATPTSGFVGPTGPAGGPLPNWFNVITYGATGNGTTDDTLGIQAAITAAAAAGSGAVLYFPLGTYKTSSGFTITTNMMIKGFDGGPGSKPTLLSTGNYSFFQLNAEVACEGLHFRGSGTVANTLERAVTATVNNICFRDCSFENFYDCFVYDSTGALTPFYGVLSRCVWLSAINSMLRTIPNGGGSGPGVDFLMVDCQFEVGQTNGVSPAQYPAYAWLFDNIGSINCSTTIISPPNCTVAGVKFNTYSSAAGNMVFDNCVFEAGAVGAPAVWLAGSNANKCKFFYANNCTFGQSNTSGAIGALRIDYATECHFVLCQFGANIAVDIHNYAMNCSFVSCDFECLNSVFFGASGAIIQFLSILNPQFSGATAFINFGLLVQGYTTGLWGLTVIGGETGTAAIATKYQIPTNANTFISVPEPTNALRGGDNVGATTLSGNGVTTLFSFPHNCATKPVAVVCAASGDVAARSFYVYTDATNINIQFVTAPASGTNNLIWNWIARAL